MVGNAAQWREAKLSRVLAGSAREALEAGRRQIKNSFRTAEHAAKRNPVRASHNGRRPLLLGDIVDVYIGVRI